MQPLRHALPDGPTTLSIAAFLLFWQACAFLAADPLLFPGPARVLLTIIEEAASGALFFHTSATLARVTVAFFLALILGSGLGLWLGLSPQLARWAGPWVAIFLNLPALVVIVLCYVWIGLNETAAILAVTLAKMPMVLATVREGVAQFDRGLADMATVFRLSRMTQIRFIYLPQLTPYFAVSARNGIAVIWKIVLMVEFLGRSSGAGFQIHLYFQLFDLAHVLAYALSFVAIMVAVDIGLVQPLVRHASRWRPAMVSA